MQYGEKFASKRAAKAVAGNCAVMPYIYGEKSSQISAAMNLTESLVRTNLHRAREKLKKFLSERGYDYV